MDSLTQIVLGAGVGELVLGKKIGNKAQLFGAIAGTIPDLDIILSVIYDDPISKLLIHRSYSHALPVHLVLALLPAYWCYVAYKKSIKFNQWYLLWMLGLTTHAILDSFTTYGTRLFLPFTDYQVGFNNINVIDPLYTLPFMAMLVYCLFLRRDNPNRFKWAKRAMYISSGYMALTFIIKWHVHGVFKDELKKQHLSTEHIYTTPTFFNNALWACIAADDSTIRIGEYSILQGGGSVDFVSYPRNLSLDKGFEGKGLRTLKWFSQGKYFYKSIDSNTLRVFIIKWGRSDFRYSDPEKAFVFYYDLDKRRPDEIIAHEPDFEKFDMKEAFAQLFTRIVKK